MNVNRTALMADGSWWLGIHPDGPSDKEVAVVKLESLEARPIAVLINYAVHGTAMGQENLQLSGDLPGATSRCVEDRLGGDVVALWTSGAAGDQAPIYDRVPDDFHGMEAMGSILADDADTTADVMASSPAPATANPAFLRHGSRSRRCGKPLFRSQIASAHAPWNLRKTVLRQYDDRGPGGSHGRRGPRVL